MDTREERLAHGSVDISHTDAPCVTKRKIWRPTVVIKNLRNHYPVQGVKARERHSLAGVPEGPCGIEELQAFQTALGNQYQLYVVSASKSYMYIFKGDPAPHVIGLLYHDTHNDTIISFTGVFNRGRKIPIIFQLYETI